MNEDFPMESPPSLAQSHSFASAGYSEVQVVANFMEHCNTMIPNVLSRPDLKLRDDAIKSLWERSYAWIQTLLALNKTVYYQAYGAGNRALFELTIDTLLLCHDKSNASGQRMGCFRESESLKMAESTINFYIERSEPVPNENDVFRRFVVDHKDRINKMRLETWPNPKGKATHPDRWTGKDLSKDAQAADKAYGSFVVDELGVSMNEYYRTRIRRLNWDVHSGLASAMHRPAESFDINCAFASMWSADLAVLSTKVVLADFQLTTSIPNYQKLLQHIESERNRVFCEVIDRPTKEEGKGNS